MSSACEHPHRPMTEGPGLNRLSYYLNHSIIPSLLISLREGNSLYIKIVSVMQL